MICTLCNRPILPIHQSLECDGKQYHRDESECIKALVAELEQARKWSSAWKKLAHFWRNIATYKYYTHNPAAVIFRYFHHSDFDKPQLAIAYHSALRDNVLLNKELESLRKELDKCQKS